MVCHGSLMDNRSNRDVHGLFSLVAGLFAHVSARRRGQFLLLLLLTLISAVAEVVSLGAVVPFVGILTQPEKVFANPSMEGIIRLMGIASPSEMVLPLTIGFATAALAAGAIRLLLLWVSIRLGNATGADLSIEIFNRTLYQPYHVHVARSSSEIISGITQKVGVATSVLVSLVTAVTSTILFVAILITLVVIDPMIAMVTMGGFGVCYALIAWGAKRRLHANSGHVAQEQTRVVKILQEGLGGIRDVLIDGTQAVYSNGHGTAVRKLQQATGENRFINQAPRFAMESLGMVMIAALAYVLSTRSDGIGEAVPVLAALALGAQRLLPLLQQLYGNWVVVAGSQMALHDVLDLLEQPLPTHAHEPAPEPMAFTEGITFEDVSFKYGDNAPWILDGVNLHISKGSRIGFVGATGSGKSTLLDLLAALLEPTRGRVLVDGYLVKGAMQRAWQRNIAHVPQSIFLVDGTIAENIAFGIPKDEIDMERVRQAAAQAHIGEFIESRAEGYEAFVGERGVRLSGGQRQRIGIARALYKNAAVLIFDEATSALDGETEKSVMEAIENLDEGLTILIIAHRLSTLHQCDTIIRLNQGKIMMDSVQG